MGDLVSLIGEIYCTCFPLRGTFLISMHPVPHFLTFIKKIIFVKKLLKKRLLQQKINIMVIHKDNLFVETTILGKL